MNNQILYDDRNSPQYKEMIKEKKEHLYFAITKILFTTLVGVLLSLLFIKGFQGVPDDEFCIIGYLLLVIVLLGIGWVVILQIWMDFNRDERKVNRETVSTLIDETGIYQVDRLGFEVLRFSFSDIAYIDIRQFPTSQYLDFAYKERSGKLLERSSFNCKSVMLPDKFINVLRNKALVIEDLLSATNIYFRIASDIIKKYSGLKIIGPVNESLLLKMREYGRDVRGMVIIYLIEHGRAFTLNQEQYITGQKEEIDIHGRIVKLLSKISNGIINDVQYDIIKPTDDNPGQIRLVFQGKEYHSLLNRYDSEREYSDDEYAIVMLFNRILFDIQNDGRFIKINDWQSTYIFLYPSENAEISKLLSTSYGQYHNKY